MNAKALVLLLVGALPVSAISAEKANRIKYSTQTFVCLDVGETYVYKLKNASERRIRLQSVVETSDSVIGLTRLAEILVEIDGKPLTLVCEPYVMPTEVLGLRIQADTTNRWMDLPKRVQFSLWDASDPIVDTDLFVFPLAGYSLFSQGTQGYNEPVHWGDRDGDPAGQRFYHNYGFDMAGFEGRDEVVACADATVIGVYPDVGTLLFEDDRGFVFEYGHMEKILPEIKDGLQVKRGRKLGLLGRRGGSGNFSHLHVGAYLSTEDLAAGRNFRNLNLYPWMMEAFRRSSGRTLFAVARPHHTVRTGETVRFDARRSLSYGSKIKSFRWVFHDGTSVNAARAEKVYPRPGTYIAALWVTDEKGSRDVDFCKVKVYSRDKLEDVMPIFFLTHSPSRNVRAGQTVRFRGWPQGAQADAVRIDFGDGVVIQNYQPFSDVGHAFRTPGIHVVTATTTADGFSVTQKVKVIVE
jgi:hypothetical protein